MKRIFAALTLSILFAVPAIAHDSHAHCSTPPPQGSGSSTPTTTVTNDPVVAPTNIAVNSSSSTAAGGNATATGGQGGSVSNSGNSSNSNDNKNTSSSNAKQSQVANGGTGGSANNNGNAQSTNISTPRDAAPAAPVFVSETSPCRIGVGGSFSFLTGGGAAGTSRADKSCQDLEIAKTLYQMGEKSSAILMVCHTAEAHKAKLPLCSSGATIQ